jgi:hypothetical protein
LRRRAKDVTPGAVEQAEAMRPLIEETAELSLRAPAAKLFEAGIKTAEGKAWTPAQGRHVGAALLVQQAPAA